MGIIVKMKGWDLTFVIDRPAGEFCPLSTHCGFHDEENSQLVICGPEGHHVTIERCVGAQALDNKLYTIEKLSNADSCYLRIRTLEDTPKVVSDVEASIGLRVPETSFARVYQNGFVVLFSNHGRSPIFVNTNLHEVQKSPQQLSMNARTYVNPANGDLWSWDEFTKEIWKITGWNTKFMGSIQGGSQTTLLHVDAKDQLYFI
jgi:hypothetical protein